MKILYSCRDLSFNNLSGPIPDTFWNPELNYMYGTEQKLVQLRNVLCLIYFSNCPCLDPSL